MTDEAPHYYATFSHEFEAGPSGPARSYWDIKFGVPGIYWAAVGTIQLHHREQNQADLYANSFCHMLGEARKAGALDKGKEIRRVLGVKP